MAKVATDFMKRHNWTFETPLSELAQYTEEINKSLRDDRKVRSNAKTRFRQLGLTKEQVEVLIPIRPTGKLQHGITSSKLRKIGADHTSRIHGEKLAQIFGLDEQNAKVYSALFGENMILKKQLEDYHS
ncbi:5521_t:CDS:2 [Funneliformis geosporum]|nr:5521_t:CDS:2 [Funneliformis geosporum]